MRPLLVLAGTFAPQQICNKYYASLYPTKVMALPDGGRNRLRQTYGAILPHIQEWMQQQDEAVVLAGHSQGAIHALSYALDYPHLVHEVVGIAGPFDGANGPAFSAGLRQYVKRIIPVGVDFQRGAHYLIDLQRRAAVSPLSITLVAGMSDMLVTPQSALAINPAEKHTFEGGHTTVMHQRDTKHLLRLLRES